ncbi:MAG: hypothetical protein M3Q24_01085 [bacterium]|nr:hypothetical protein [bacterium]
MNESTKIIEEKFNELPKDLQSALSAVDWRSEIKKISTEKNLSIEQIQTLETETLLILYGFTSKDDFYENLVVEVNLNEELASEIFDLIQERVVVKLADKMGGISDNTAFIVPSLNQDPAINTSDEPVRPHLTSIPNYSDYKQGEDPYREPTN